MPGIARGGDTCTTGHISCDLETTLDENSASPDVYVDNRRVERLGDPTVSHLYPEDPTDSSGESCSPHIAPISSASENIFVNGKGVARLGDSVDDGGQIIEASPNVFA